MNVLARPSFQVESGALAAMKWLGLVLMVVDHMDAFVYGRTLGWATDLGRLVMPLFAFVVAYNLARPGAMERGVHGRMLRRLLSIGVLAAPFHAVLTGAAWGVPANIMLTFAVAVGCIALVERKEYVLAAALFYLGGGLVEYAWAGVGLVLATWAMLRFPCIPTALLLGLALLSMETANGSQAALWALPVVLLASRLRVSLPRAQWAFYAFYPAHLAAFWLFRTF